VSTAFVSQSGRGAVRGRKPLCVAPSEAFHGRLTAIRAPPSLALLNNFFF
jgi:hypothetical protein